MPLRINQNITALNAWRYVGLTDASLAKSIERLSSGLRVNRAADDPAAFVTSEYMRSTIAGIGQAIKNVGDAISMMQTIEGAFDEMSSLLTNIRTLALHAANTGPNDADALAADQAQIQNALNSLQNIASTRRYGARVLVDGTWGRKGYTNNAGVEFITAGVDTAVNADLLVATYGFLVSILGGATRSSLLAASSFGGVSLSLAQAENLVINGVKIVLPQAILATQAAALLNTYREQTGVRATLTAGRVLVFESLRIGSQFTIAVATDQVAANGTSGVGGNNQYTVGADAMGRVNVVSGGGGVLAAFPMQGVGEYLYALPGRQDYLGTPLNLADDLTMAGLKIRVVSALASQGASNLTTTAMLWLNKSPLNFQIGPDAGQQIGATVENMQAQVLGLAGNLINVDVRSRGGAAEAVNLIQEALSQVMSQRGALGALQKQYLESTRQNLGVYQENYQAAESQIRDADMAFEMIQFTRNQIMLQAGTAMLAQANMAPQVVLELLR